MTASGPAEEFAAIAKALRGGRTVEQTYQAIVEAAPRVVEGCDRAAIGVLEGDRFRTAAASDEVMRAIDALQNDLREGPCLEASADESVHLDNDISHACAWPRLAARVLAETPVRAMLAVPLVLDGRRSGALNLFADRADAFNSASIDSGAVLAAFATVAVSAAVEAARADQLQAGLQSNREIGAAIGILMATHKLSSDEAFAVLAQASQRLNRKLRDIAAGIVRGGEPTAGK
jgi:transcriptional regulator with GAF, ATPase, and Fis domain